MNNLIEISNLNVFIKTKIIEDISFKIERGKTLGLVGESGCGKTTLAKAILRLIPSFGNIFFEKKNILQMPLKHFQTYRQKIQMIFQDPFSSLNPRMSVKEILQEPLKIHKIDKPYEKFLDYVKLPRISLNKFPHEFSGGQRQRIGIARALTLNPDFLILDEPVSALDVSIQADIINLLKDLQKEFNLTYLFISHDLAVVKYISDDIAIMRKGKILEIKKTRDLFENPSNHYTKKILNFCQKIEI